MPQDIRAIIADDHPIFRHGLADAIRKDARITIVGEAENGAEVIELVGRLDPDIVILDIDMPIMDGVETAKRLAEMNLRAEVIFLTIHKDRKILRAMGRLRVKGYVLKESALSEVIQCINAVLTGKTFLSQKLKNIVVDDSQLGSAVPGLFALNDLTLTEKKILIMLTESCTTRDIAKDLFVSHRTVDSHRYNICAKLRLKGTHALIKFAMENKSQILSMIAK